MSYIFEGREYVLYKESFSSLENPWAEKIILGQRTNFWTEEEIFSCAEEQYCLEKCHCRTWVESPQRLTLT